MDEDLKIVLTSELEADEEASAQRISAQLPNIAKLINSKNSIKVGVTLDEAGIQSQTQRITQQIARATKSQSVGVSLSLDQSSVNKIKTELNNLKVSPDISRAMTDQLDQMGIQIDRITGRWEAVNGEEERMLNLTIQGTDQMQRTVTYLQTYNAETGEINTHLTNVTANLERQRREQEQVAAQAKKDNESRVSYLNRQKALLADIQAAYVGQTSVKPITDSAHLTALNDTYAAVNARIETMIAAEGRLDNVQRSNLEAQISGLQRLVKEYQNAEYVATKLRTKDIGSIKADQLSGLEALEKRLESAGTLTDTFKSKIDGLKKTLQGVGTKDQLVAFLNSFDQLNNDVAVFQERLRGANKIYTQLISLDKQITSVQSSMTKLNTSDDKNKLLALQGQLSVLNNQRAALEAQLVPYADIIQYAKQATALEQSRLLNGTQLVYTQMELADKARDYDVAMQSIPSTIADLQTKFSQVVAPTENLVQNMRLLRETAAQYGADMGDREKVTTYERLQSLIGACSKEMSELLRVQRGDVNDFKFTQNLEKAKADLETVGRTWSALKQDPGLNAQFQQLSENLKRVDNQMDLRKWTAQFSTFKSEVKAAGKNMQSLGDILKNNVGKVLQWVSATTLLFRAFRLLRSALTTIVDLDTAMIDLQKVTTATREEYDRFYHSANGTAKALGVTTEEVISQTAEWARLGYAMQDAAKLAENSAIFEAISPDMDITQATDGLVSIIKAYDLDVEDSLDGIISKVNEVGNKFAVSNGDIVEAMTRSSAAMAAANNTFEETVALATAAIEITRDAATVGNGLKTLSMRIRGYDEETEEYSADVSELTGTIADLTKVASNNNRGISLFEADDPETYRSTYDILSDIADIWDELTDKNRANLLEALFGKRQAQIGAAILSNFDQARSAIVKMEESAGSAGREMDKITQSLDYINSLTDLNEENRDGSESWKELGQDIKEARKQIMELLDGIVEEASDAVDTIQNVYDTLHDAADEYAQSGFITVDTLQSIIGLGQKYVAYLIDENGQLVINEERIQAVIAARTQQMAIESSLAYVEALRMAKSEGDIATLNNLLYATEQATNATWGLVYANLALAGLDEDQYQAALRNINAIRAMADSAVQSIGKTVGGVTDELEEMQNGLNDILDYVMDMLKQRIQDQIDGLEDMKDAYSEIIDLKKQSLEASKDEADHQKTMASKMREIAKLQARIDMLSLDDSREAQAEKAALLEELSKLQSDLADEQADRTLEAQEDALDKMEESYHDEKDKEIKILEDSISSHQKLYDMAISYIESHWDTLYSELISWNTQYGDVLNSDIANAWDNCLAAAQRYGSYVSALGSIGGDIKATQSSGTNFQVGNATYDNSSSGEDMIHAIIKEMYANSKQHAYEDAAGKLYLNRRNLELGAQLAQYGITAVRGSDGVWYVDRVGGQLLYDKYRKYTYHEGGIVGGGDIKSNEQLSLLKTKEWVLSEQMVNNLTTQMDRINMLSDAMSDLPDYAGKSTLSDVMKQVGGSKTVNNITNNSRPIEVQIGDTIIHGADQSTVDKHIKVTRDMVNQIGRLIGIGR